MFQLLSLRYVVIFAGLCKNFICMLSYTNCGACRFMCCETATAVNPIAFTGCSCLCARNKYNSVNRQAQNDVRRAKHHVCYDTEFPVFFHNMLIFSTSNPVRREEYIILWAEQQMTKMTVRITWIEFTNLRATFGPTIWIKPLGRLPIVTSEKTR